jgi:hypothetical protein
MEVFAMKRFVPAWLPATLAVLICCGSALAADYSDQALFSTVTPDAMIVLDLSGSMRWNPRGEYDSRYGPKQDPPAPLAGCAHSIRHGVR